MKRQQNSKFRTMFLSILTIIVVYGFFATSSGLSSSLFPVFAQTPPTPHRLKAVLISEDGANAELVHKLIKAGRLPNLKTLSETGTHSRFVVPHFPSKTAPGHASLFCGCYGNVHGIVSNSVQKGKGFNILETSSGFDAGNLTAEPIWVTASRQGLKTVVLYAALSSPAEKFVKDGAKGNLIILEGYPFMKSSFKALKSSEMTEKKVEWSNLPPHEGDVETFTFKAGDTKLYAAALDVNINNKPDYSVVVVGESNVLAKGKAVLMDIKDSPCFSSSIVIKYGNEYSGVCFQLLSLNESGEGFEIVQSASYLERINGKPVSRKFIEETGSFIGNGSVSLYMQGKLGKPLFQGGDGKAEERYLESVRLINRILSAKLRYSVKKFSPDFVVGYTPYPDETLHMWLGYAKTGWKKVPPCSEEAGEKFDNYLFEAFSSADEYLGEVLAVSSPETYIFAASDHGMDSYDRLFFPNVVLKEAGLLVYGKDKKIDLSRTKIIYGRENGAFLRVNSTDYKDGIVSVSDKEKVIQEAVTALSKVRDPETGEALVTGFYYPSVDGDKFGIGGERGGDIYLDILPGYYFSDGYNDLPIKKVSPAGQHVYMPERESIHSMLYCRGPGIKAGGVIPGHRITDIAPSICRLLNIEPPKNAERTKFLWE